MRYAEVSVNSPAAQRRTFSYAIPPGLDVAAGQAVLVPFGPRTLQGVVMELAPHPAVEEVKEIAGVIEDRPLLSPQRVALSRWISEHYLSPLFDAVALMLPPGFGQKTETFLSLAGTPADDTSLAPEQAKALELARRHSPLSLKELEKALGKKRAGDVAAQLVRIGLLARRYQLEPPRIKARKVAFISLNIPAGLALELSAGPEYRRAAGQARLLGVLARSPDPLPLAEARRTAGCAPAAVKALLERGLLRLEDREVRREPLLLPAVTSPPPQLTPAQQAALQPIVEALRQGRSAVFLLHGVTGSGKTEVYLRALAEAVALGRRGIALVPEIALTTQTIERFGSRFPGKVSVLHSRLTPGQRYDQWQRIRDGDMDVVIGSRSALFAPQPDLGLIIIDEEHEWTYKQEDQPPLYHARDAAVKLAGLTGTVVILGSATPDVETFHRARNGQYRLLQLPERVAPGASLPRVNVVDMREELKSGNRSIISRPLAGATATALAGGEQAIMFLNRRGTSTFIQCRKCGFVLRCRRCDVSLTHHADENALVCHQCNRRSAVPHLCPACSSRHLKFLGTGTQKLEQELNQAFPAARTLRWDRDTAKRDSHDAILRRFREHQADILIGTQMVAKGLDLPSVTLVGVVSADLILNLPDFRAAERTFQLLSQVAGRAGRGAAPGQVFIQTFAPEHYAIQAAAAHDYEGLYQKEISHRRQLRNPPFTRLALLVYSHSSEARCQQETERMKRYLIAERDARGVEGLDVVGPASAFIHRLRGRYRWQLVLRGYDLSCFLSPLAFPRGWGINIDPVSLA